MKRKYKLYLFSYIMGLNLIDTLIVLFIVFKNPDKQLPIAVVAFIIHTAIMCIGAYIIARRGKLDSMTAPGQ